ncbi:hypothetical protein PGTUg99_025411 [Puccinia graminis f. sp. tritici]|uniref:Uncharacterized protein n=1 Tax=Puccinia graminis f. sp. tritici TaxID=56615 RepID=A0A5B0RZ11_PUCGR|nr:hypothetical protein PGTUg99_025411 [Puccinia graminis f. sp. tritici]
MSPYLSRHSPDRHQNLRKIKNTYHQKSARNLKESTWTHLGRHAIEQRQNLRKIENGYFGRHSLHQHQNLRNLENDYRRKAERTNLRKSTHSISIRI